MRPEGVAGDATGPGQVESSDQTSRKFSRKEKPLAVAHLAAQRVLKRKSDVKLWAMHAMDLSPDRLGRFLQRFSKPTQNQITEALEELREKEKEIRNR